MLAGLEGRAVVVAAAATAAAAAALTDGYVVIADQNAAFPARHAAAEVVAAAEAAAAEAVVVAAAAEFGGGERAAGHPLIAMRRPAGPFPRNPPFPANYATATARAYPCPPHPFRALLDLNLEKNENVDLSSVQDV